MPAWRTLQTSKNQFTGDNNLVDNKPFPQKYTHHASNPSSIDFLREIVLFSGRLWLSCHFDFSENQPVNTFSEPFRNLFGKSTC